MAVPSFPDVHVTGPVQHFIRAGGASGQIYFLGTCEVTPQMQRRKYKSDVKNDIAGNQLPFQRTYDGEAAMVSALLNRYSKDAWTEILLAGLSSGNVINPGNETRWSRGHLVFGQSTFELWQVYDNFFNPMGSSANLEIGWYWPQVELLDHNTIAAGTRDEKLLLVFDCTPYWIPQANHYAVNSSLNERGWVLYTNDPFDFPADVRVPQ